MVKYYFSIFFDLNCYKYMSNKFSLLFWAHCGMANKRLTYFTIFEHYRKQRQTPKNILYTFYKRPMSVPIWDPYGTQMAFFGLNYSQHSFKRNTYILDSNVFLKSIRL